MDDGGYLGIEVEIIHTGSGQVGWRFVKLEVNSVGVEEESTGHVLYGMAAVTWISNHGVVMERVFCTRQKGTYESGLFAWSYVVANG